MVVKAGVLACAPADHPGVHVFFIPDELEHPCIVSVIYVGGSQIGRAGERDRKLA
jgi:hypothetical protein